MTDVVSESTMPVKTFERKATGLVRAAGTLDVLVYNINFVSIGLMGVLVFLFATAFYPGANLYATALLTFAAVIPTSLVFAFFAAAMPRSGADYVYVSRTLHPALGMMSSWNNTAWWFMYGGVPSAFFAYYGVGPFFSVVGSRTGTHWMVSFGNWCVTPLGAFVVGSVLIIALVAIFIMGLHVFFRLQNVFFVLGMLSVLLIAFTWLFQSSGSFAHNVTAHTGQAFGTSLNHAAAKAGYIETGPFSLKWTLLAGTWIYINLVFNQSSAYIGGEVRRASRLQLWSMPAAAVVTTAILMILLGLGDKIAGLHTLGKLSAATALPFSALAAQGVGSTVLAALILFGFIFFSYTWLPGQILNASRNFLAYSLDGLMPRKLGDVHPRYHTPVYALLLVGAGSIGLCGCSPIGRRSRLSSGSSGSSLDSRSFRWPQSRSPTAFRKCLSPRRCAGGWEGSPSCRSSEPCRWWRSGSWHGRSGPIRTRGCKATSGPRFSTSRSLRAASCCTSWPSSFSAGAAWTSASASRRFPSSSWTAARIA